jgi:acyl-CoA synthetase (AMP-forming)/AMP-acid ligase II
MLSDDLVIHRRVQEIACLTPDRVFAYVVRRTATEALTYGELWRQAAVVRDAVGRLGARTGDPVAIILRHSSEVFPCFIGAMSAGAVPTILPFPSVKQDTRYYWASHSELFGRIGVRLVIAYEDLLSALDQNFPDREFKVVTPTDLMTMGADPGVAPTAVRDASADDVALLQHSSGTTGLKKGVVLSHRAIGAQIKNYARAIEYEPDDIIATWLPFYHDMGLIACFMMPVLMGASIVVLDPFEWVARPKLLLEAIEKHRATFCWLPNFAFQHIPMSLRPGETYDLSSVRAFINCSEPCKPHSFEMFLDRLAACGVKAESLQVCYAMAENTFAVTQTHLGDRARVLRIDRRTFEEHHRAVPAETAAPDCLVYLSCGPAIPHTELRIVDSKRNPLAAGCVGEIAVSSDSVFTGYQSQPDLTRQKLGGRWYYTGDLGFVLDGELYVTGRADDLLIVYGRNFYAHEIENVVGSVKGIVPGRVVAFVVENERSGTRDLVILAEAPSETDPVAVKRAVKEAIVEQISIAPHVVEIVPHGWLWKTTSGKISRKFNEKRYLAEFRAEV